MTELEFARPSAENESVLESDEFIKLSIRQGSLSPKERKAIQAHVSFTYQFLNKIPWTDELSNIPDIAHAHHEKIDGSGYPRGIAKDEIPLGAKVMTVTDILMRLLPETDLIKRP